jgi:FSR family fosmidomycin resistance protein-like MFS transporter
MFLSSRQLDIYSIVNKFAKEQKMNFKTWAAVIAILLLLSIIIRSFVGFIVNYPWKVWTLVIIFTIAIVLWKALWWVFADKFGWKKVWVISLLLSLPCLLFGSQSIVFGMIGIFLFNITMPIALIALIKAMPKRRWLAFGLLCLALLLGSLPSLLGVDFSGIVNILLIILILISSFVLYFALDCLNIEE